MPPRPARNAATKPANEPAAPPTAGPPTKKKAAKKKAARKPAKKTAAKQAVDGPPASPPARRSPSRGRSAKTAAKRPSAEMARRAAIGHAIAIRRVERRLTRRELAESSGLSYPYVSEIERGAKRPSAAALDAVARALETTAAALLARADLSAAEASVTGTAGRPARAGGADPTLVELVRSVVRDELTRSRVSAQPPATSEVWHVEPAGHGPPARRAGRGDEAFGAAGTPGVAGTTEAVDGTQIEDEDTLRAQVLVGARAMLGSDDIRFDQEGDIPVRRGEVMLFIRVLDDPLSVLVFSPVLVNVTESAALLDRVNELNANLHFVRFCVTHGGVVIDAELFGEQFRPELLPTACRAITDAAEAVGPDLQEEFGGRLFLGDESEAKPRRDTGGYL